MCVGLATCGARCFTWPHQNWATDARVDLKNVFNAVTQLAPLMEALAAALSKTIKGTAHIDLLASGLFGTCKGAFNFLFDGAGGWAGRVRVGCVGRTRVCAHHHWVFARVVARKCAPPAVARYASQR